MLFTASEDAYNKFTMRKAYVFRGSPSSGKGTLTERFIKLIPGKVSLLELDTFRWGFHKWNRRIPDDFTDEDHQLAYENFLTVLENYCKNGKYNLVIEGLFAWDKKSPHGNMQDIIALLKKYDFDYKLFLLYGDKEVLWERNTKREYAVPKDEFEMLYHNVMDKIGDEEIKVNVGSMTINETVDFIKGQTGLLHP